MLIGVYCIKSQLELHEFGNGNAGGVCIDRQRTKEILFGLPASQGDMYCKRLWKVSHWIWNVFMKKNNNRHVVEHLLSCWKYYSSS